MNAVPLVLSCGYTSFGCIIAVLVCSIIIIAAGYHAFSLTGTVGVSFQHKAMPAVTQVSSWCIDANLFAHPAVGSCGMTFVNIYSVQGDHACVNTGPQ